MTVLEIGIDEDAFWEMTMAQVNRRVEVFNKVYKVYKRQMRERANMDWQLANLIGISVGRCLSKDAKMPSVYEAYPDLFDEEKSKEILQKQQTDISVARFLEYATAHNLKRKVANKNE